MTSAEFATKYRVMKSLSDAGVRSQIAQEVALGRMVMVHTLDQLSSTERQTLLRRLDALPPEGASKIFSRFEVDGTPVVDIKPVMREFLPRTEVRQPAWSTELMSEYWTVASS